MTLRGVVGAASGTCTTVTPEREVVCGFDGWLCDVPALLAGVVAERGVTTTPAGAWTTDGPSARSRSEMAGAS